LVTNGIATTQVYWVEHTGIDLYFGMSGIKGKRTYHASGKQHSTYFGTRDHEAMGIPLENITGVYPLSNMLVGDLTEQLKYRGATHKYSGRKSDSVLMLDARAIPKRAECHIEIGVLNPGNIAALDIRLGPYTVVGRQMDTQQSAIATLHKPWIYALAQWLLP
jgi:hypothetical protein